MAGRRKKVAKKKPKRAKKRTRTAARSQKNSDAAWKVAERKVARYFGTERAGRGQKGSDSREVPLISEWLRLRAPDLVKPVEPWTHIVPEVKCRKEILPIVERWHHFTLSNPRPKDLVSLQVTGPLKVERDPMNRPFAIGMCLLDDFPMVYRVLLASSAPLPINSLAITSRFWINRDVRDLSKMVMDYFAQVEEAAQEWASKRQQIVCPLPIVYLTYPKRVRGALCFKLPTHFGRCDQ